MPLSFIFYLLFGLLGLEVVLIFAILLHKVQLKHLIEARLRAEKYLIARYFHGEEVPLDVSPAILMQTYVRLADQIQFTPDQKEKAFYDFEKLGIIHRYVRNVNSKSVLLRKRAIYYLSYFLITHTRIALVKRLRIEKLNHVKIFLVNALKTDMDQETVQLFIESLVGSRRFYQSRVIELVKSYLMSSHSHFPDIYLRPEVEIKELFVDLAASLYREDFRKPLYDELHAMENHFAGRIDPTYAKMKLPRVKRLYYHILSVMSTVYGVNLETEQYVNNPDPEVAKIALESMAKTKTFDQIRRIVLSADGTENDEFRVRSIARIIESNKNYYDLLLDLSSDQLTIPQNRVIAKTLVTRLEYLLLKLQSVDRSRFSRIIGLIIESGSTADLIGFLNRNKNADIEKATLAVLLPFVKANPVFQAELNEYLEADLYKRLGFVKKKVPAPEKPRSGPEKTKTKWVARIIIFAFSIFPVIFILVKFPLFFTTGWWEIVKTYIIMMNEIFIVYYLVVNAVYLVLAVLSAVGARNQSALWQIKSKSMLFERGMLASISIIAPAYNEEMSIVESVNSLLNLNYPDFEVIVVNDGSKDATLERLIEHFHLERKNLPMMKLLATRPVKAIYKNKYYPTLTVVDKLNGGKADALNVGINVAKNDYICGIDADSILESESLLKLMSSMLDHDEITLALGGNIFPVNGCVVDHGQIETKALPKNLLARLQSIEYLRAFSLGRIGWSVLNSLLIVSGAFGLFEKQILIECGGYLTQSTKEKDTVGEDMELVIRITRQAYDTNLKFRVDYIHNAVCYTEVPEETKSLLKQRNRWQRGLIDILSYHRKMIFNRRYRQAGLIGIPYFYIFETIGPLLEIQGYAAIFLGIIFELLNIQIVLLLLIVTVLMGIGLSMAALLVTERDSIALDFKDTMKLLIIGIFENFGWRQFIGIYRVKGIFSSLKENNVWGTVKRVGFKK